MKKEDIYNGVTDIRDDLVERAGKKRRGWGALAAALAVCVALGGFGAWYLSRPDGAAPSSPSTPPDGTELSSQALAEVKYPERLKYPELEDSGDPSDMEAYDRWREEERSRRLTDEEMAALRSYVSAAMPELLRAGEGANSVVSPMNVYMALSMLAESTEGETREQIMSVLGSDTIEELRDLAGRTWDRLYNDDGTYSLYMANSLWLRDDWEYSQDTVNTLADKYYAWSFRGEMGSQEYNDTLKTWLNGNTGGLLQDQISGIELDGDTALCLASTMYFGDSWSVKFDPAENENGIFHAPGGDVEREFMYRKISFGGTYYYGDKFGAVILPFERGGAMALLLPDEGVSIEDILNDQSAMALIAGDNSAQDNVSAVIHLRLPKFDVAEQVDLTDALKGLGITDAFDREEADFSPLVPDDTYPVWVSKAIHGARVRVDEDGCEAAVYTIMPAPGAGMPPENSEIQMTFDRPFVFSVISQNLPIFAGIVTEP